MNSMLKIKLSRTGKKHEPSYRIVVIEAREKRDGKYVENLGYYIPTSTPETISLDLERYNAWLQKGAQPTLTVANLAKNRLDK